MVMTAVADEFVGRAHAGTSVYGLFYRSTDHRRLKKVCVDVGKATPPARFLPHMPAGGIDRRMRIFAAVVTELQERRHTADYDPAFKFNVRDTRLLIETATTAMEAFRDAPPAHRRAFLAVLLFPPRG